MNIDKEDGLILEEITFPGGNTIRLRLVAPSGEERIFNYPVHPNGMVGLSEEYSDDYGDGPPFPVWPNHLAATVWEARQQPLPVGDKRDETLQRALDTRRARWTASRSDPMT